jgi:Bacterial Ig-like domain (group 3)
VKPTSQANPCRHFPFAVIRAVLLSVSLTLSFDLSAHDLASASRDTGGPLRTDEPLHAAPVSLGSPKQASGIVAIIHSDDFDRGHSTHTLVVHEDNGRDTPVRFAGVPPALGTRVIVTGALGADGGIDSAEVASAIDLEPMTLAPMGGSQNAIFILVKFLDTASVPFTQAAVEAVAVSNTNSVANYFQEVSFGQRLLNITVTPWLVAQMNTSTSCDYTSIANAANAAATKAGYNLGSYTNKYYVMPHNSACGWMGLAYLGSPYLAWSNGYNSVQVYTHELGHNFTLDHAGTVNCGTQVLASGCSVAEYGDPFDTMGNQASMHYNAMQKSLLGWLPASSVITHPGGTATYNLSPIETGGAQTYAVKIAAASNRTYWIEYRQPLGFDIGLSSKPNNGVQIRVSAPFQNASGYDDTELLDMTPGSAGGFGDATLVAGKSYTDSTYGITISVPSVSATLATVQVSSAALAATSTALTSSANPAAAGTTVTFTATVTGKSPTGTVSFTANGGALCSGVALSSGVAQCKSASLPAGTDNIVAKYSGDAANSPSTSSTLAPTVVFTSPGNGATVTGPTTVSVKASDNVAVGNITLAVDGKTVATTNTTSVSYKWNAKKAASGMHTLSATATDASGNKSTTTISVKK